MSRFHQTIGDCKNRLEQWTEAEEAYNAAMEAIKDQHKDEPDQKKRKSRILHQIGIIKQKTGDLEEAVEKYDQALELRQDVFGPDHAECARTLMNKGICLLHMDVKLDESNGNSYSSYSYPKLDVMLDESNGNSYSL